MFGQMHDELTSCIPQSLKCSGAVSLSQCSLDMCQSDLLFWFFWCNSLTFRITDFFFSKESIILYISETFFFFFFFVSTIYIILYIWKPKKKFFFDASCKQGVMSSILTKNTFWRHESSGSCKFKILSGWFSGIPSVLRTRVFSLKNEKQRV